MPLPTDSYDTIEVENSKSIQDQIIQEAENLEKPADSVAFLQYMMKHAEKVDTLQKRLHSFSRTLMAAGLAIAGFAAFSYMTRVEVAAPKHGRLSASHETLSASDEGLTSMFSGLSVLIWSMIAAKAKTGMNAATSGEIKSVSAALKQAGSLIIMIAVASGFNIYASMDTTDQIGNNLSASVPSSSTGRQLKASHQLKDSHYKGGVAAAAFEQFSTMSSEDFLVAKTPPLKEVPAAQRGRMIGASNVPKIGSTQSTQRGRSTGASNIPSIGSHSSQPKTASIDLILNSFDKKASK